MARTYKRDSRGRFASGGGGSSGGSKAASTRKANTARANQLRGKGTIAIGSRVKANGFVGGKGALNRAGGLRGSRTIQAGARANTVNSRGGMSSAQKIATTAANRARARSVSKAGQAGKPLARTNKSPANAAKARYKGLTAQARKSSPFRSAAENRAAAGARRSMNAMVAKRGRR